MVESKNIKIKISAKKQEVEEVNAATLHYVPPAGKKILFYKATTAFGYLSNFYASPI